MHVLAVESKMILWAPKHGNKKPHRPALTSGVTGGGTECPPETSDREIFADLPGKKRQGKKGKGGRMEKKRKKIVKKKVENWKWKEGKLQNEETILFFFFFPLFKMTKICFGSTKMDIFYWEKSISHREKNQEKWLCPFRKICLLSPWLWHTFNWHPQERDRMGLWHQQNSNAGPWSVESHCGLGTRPALNKQLAVERDNRSQYSSIFKQI